MIAIPKDDALKIFISHSHKDRGMFRMLCHLVKSCGATVMRENANGLNAAHLVSDEDIAPGGAISNELVSLIDECDLCIFLLTENSIASSWCIAELGAFWGRQKKVIPFAASKLDQDALPGLIKNVRIIDSPQDIVDELTKGAGISRSLRLETRSEWYDYVVPRFNDAQVGVLDASLSPRTWIFSAQDSSPLGNSRKALHEARRSLVARDVNYQYLTTFSEKEDLGRLAIIEELRTKEQFEAKEYRGATPLNFVVIDKELTVFGITPDVSGSYALAVKDTQIAELLLALFGSLWSAGHGIYFDEIRRKLA